MTDIRRTLLWVVFTMSLFLLWDRWNQQHGGSSLFGGPRPPATTAQAPAASPPPAGTAALPAATGAASAGSAAGVPAGAPAAAAAAAPGALVTVTTDLVRASFDSHGASLVRLELLRHPDQQAQGEPVVLFDRSASRVYLAQTGLVTAASGVALPNHLTPMHLTPGPLEMPAGAHELSIRFESDPVDGRRLIKTFTFERGSYAIGVRHEFVNGGSTPVKPELYLQLTRDGNPPPDASSFYSTFTGPALYTEASKYRKLSFKSIDKNDAEFDKRADAGWVAMVQHYFASAWLVPTPGEREFRVAKTGENLYSIAMVLPLGEVAPGATVAKQATLYAGPEEEKRLAALAPGLELVKDYGWLTVLAKPLFWLLAKLHGWLGNWGWAIVVLVMILKAAFFWLNASAYRSMAKMKAVNPRVMELRERYKDKPQQMQQEMMRIYREEKVNPLGGCLPIVVQIPFFIALYWVLLSSVEMRGAPWLGWIHDLSARDPYFILPILMTGSSLLQVALNPTPPDPTQAKMMWIMPLAFSFMFFFFPAGLVLYWLTNNLLSIAQQWYINRKLGVAR